MKLFPPSINSLYGVKYSPSVFILSKQMRNPINPHFLYYFIVSSFNNTAVTAESLQKCCLIKGFTDRRVGRARLQCDGTCAEDNFRVWAERKSPYSLTADMRSRQFSLLLAAAFCVGVARNGLTPVSCFSFTSPPSRRFVPSHSNRTLQVECS
jgi:hypothetical protein